MSLGALTLGALVLAIVLSCTSRLNVGLLAIALAWVIGVYFGRLPLREVTAGFPVDLFLTLAGVTLLFRQARVNGTLDIVAHNAVRLCRGRVGLVPIMYFVLGAALASAGPGNIATTGAARADGDGHRAADEHLAVPDGDHGRQRLQLGLAVAARADRHHRDRAHGQDRAPRSRDLPWLFNMLAHAIVAFAGYLIFGGGSVRSCARTASRWRPSPCSGSTVTRASRSA